MYSQEVVHEKMKYIFKLYSQVIDYRKTKEESNATKKIQFVVDYIHTNYDKDISLTSVADELKMNSTYLSALIKNELGFGFLDYINELRVKKSIELLKDTALTIHNIALACGYITVHSYIRNFKKYYLVTPTDFRNKLVNHQTKYVD
jgi:two-component system response regulator YesN